MDETEESEYIVDRVFRRFAEIDDKQTKWTMLDTNMSMLEWLDDAQLVRESEVVLLEHRAGKPRCKMNHSEERCFAPTIVDAAEHIIGWYKKGGKLSKDNRYVLEYYIALDNIGEIFSEVETA
jgi:hypothetical protein